MGKHNDPEGCFWSKVSVAGPDDCWLWTGATNDYGYGQINVRKKKIRVHRFGYVLANGSIAASGTSNELQDSPLVQEAFLGTKAGSARTAGAAPHHLAVPTH